MITDIEKLKQILPDLSNDPIKKGLHLDRDFNGTLYIFYNYDSKAISNEEALLIYNREHFNDEFIEKL